MGHGPSTINNRLIEYSIHSFVKEYMFSMLRDVERTSAIAVRDIDPEHSLELPSTIRTLQNLLKHSANRNKSRITCFPQNFLAFLGALLGFLLVLRPLRWRVAA